MGVVSHGYGGFGVVGVEMELVDEMHVGQSQGELVACREMPEDFLSVM